MDKKRRRDRDYPLILPGKMRLSQNAVPLFLSAALLRFSQFLCERLVLRLVCSSSSVKIHLALKLSSSLTRTLGGSLSQLTAITRTTVWSGSSNKRYLPPTRTFSCSRRVPSIHQCLLLLLNSLRVSGFESSGATQTTGSGTLPGG